MQEWNSGLNELDRQFQSLLDDFPQKRRIYHQKLAVEMKRVVQTHIAGSLNDSHGKIRSWQEEHVGSGGGYAAVRPVSGKTGANSPGAITNYLENGHKIRPPSGQNTKYHARIKVPYVNGRHFYQSASTQVEAKAISLAEDFLQDLTGKLG